MSNRLVNRLKNLNNRGDTIVEVLIVLAVLGLAFSISTATANRGLIQSRNAQEHSEALGVLSSQVELLRAAVSNQVAIPAGGKIFCMTGATTYDDSFPAAYVVPDNITADTLNDPPATPTPYPVACVQKGFYHISIIYRCDGADCSDPSKVEAISYYDLRVRWEGLGTLSRQQEEFTYRVHHLSSEASPGIGVGGAKEQLIVTAKLIPPDPGNATPSCAKDATLIRDGAVITLAKTAPLPPTTFAPVTTSGNTSTVVYNNVQVGWTYKATAVAPISTSGGSFEICTPAPGSDTASISVGKSSTINLKIRPICYATTTAPYVHYGTPYVHYGTPYVHYGEPYEHAPYEHRHPEFDWDMGWDGDYNHYPGLDFYWNDRHYYFDHWNFWGNAHYNAYVIYGDVYADPLNAGIPYGDPLNGGLPYGDPLNGGLPYGDPTTACPT